MKQATHKQQSNFKASMKHTSTKLIKQNTNEQNKDTNKQTNKETNQPTKKPTNQPTKETWNNGKINRINMPENSTGTPYVLFYIQ